MGVISIDFHYNIRHWELRGRLAQLVSLQSVVSMNATSASLINQNVARGGVHVFPIMDIEVLSGDETQTRSKSGGRC